MCFLSCSRQQPVSGKFVSERGQSLYGLGTPLGQGLGGQGQELFPDDFWRRGIGLHLLRIDEYAPTGKPRFTSIGTTIYEGIGNCLD